MHEPRTSCGRMIPALWAKRRDQWGQTRGMNDATELRRTAVARLAAGPEATARALLARLVEVFDASGAALSAYETERGWMVAIHFVEPPNATAVRALVAAGDNDAGGQCGHVRNTRRQGLDQEEPDGLTPVRAGRFIVHGAHIGRGPRRTRSASRSRRRSPSAPATTARRAAAYLAMDTAIEHSGNSGGNLQSLSR